MRFKLKQAQEAQELKAKQAAEKAKLEIQRAAIADEVARKQSEGARTKAAVQNSIEKALVMQRKLAEQKAKILLKVEEEERIRMEAEF